MSPIYRLAGEDQNCKTIKGGSESFFQACAIRKGVMSEPVQLHGCSLVPRRIPPYLVFFPAAERTQMFVTRFTHRDRILSLGTTSR